jgi:hypothetical protein
MTLEQMAWKILEYKFAYYQYAWLHPSWKDEMVVPDAVYDKLENEYRELCEQQGVDPTAADMVDFDIERASCRLVARRLSQPKGTRLR